MNFPGKLSGFPLGHRLIGERQGNWDQATQDYRRFLSGDEDGLAQIIRVHKDGLMQKNSRSVEILIDYL